ncbi:unnamed protein product [Phaeothamnion confervicola]
MKREKDSEQDYLLQDGIEKQQLLKPEATSPASPSFAWQICSAAFYALSSFSIIFANKIVLSNSFGFPSYHILALSQFAATILLLGVTHGLGLTHLKMLTADSFACIFPVTVMFGLNVVTGLGGTQRLNLPMFTVLRRFGILLTLMLEGYTMGTRTSALVWTAILLMMAGAGIAAIYDLTFDLHGYALIMLNNVFTAGYGVAIKRALVSKKVDKTTLLFYNSVFACIVMMTLLTCTGPGGAEIARALDFPFWDDWRFRATFAVASGMGCVLNYATFLCTSVNSALTTAVVGALKNVVTGRFSLYCIQ